MRRLFAAAGRAQPHRLGRLSNLCAGLPRAVVWPPLPGFRSTVFLWICIRGANIQVMKFVPRMQTRRLEALLRTFPAVFIFGPRQCGKSTLVRARYPKWLHLDLERPADFEALAADIEGFFDAHPQQVVIDEAQRLPG